jgi:hypothetical protein
MAKVKQYIRIPTAQTMAELTDEDVALIMDLAPTIDAFIKSVKAEGKRRVDGGKVVGDYYIGPGTRSRAWKSEADAKKGMASVGINDMYSPQVVLTVPAAEKKLSDVQKTKMKDYWDWHPGTPSLKKKTAEMPAGQPAQPFGDTTDILDGPKKPDW